MIVNESKVLKKHLKWKGKIEVKVKCPLKTAKDLAECYTPGVAECCLEIKKDPSLVNKLTGKGNLVAVVTDGTAILGLGNIGVEAGLPVMEGKCALFKTFGNVDAVPILIGTTDVNEIVNTVKNISKSFAGINLEDIAAPRCFEVEKRLIDELDIPVFHDDQHGTAIVVGAALINACRLENKEVKDLSGVIIGAGAAGISIAKILLSMGVKDLILVDKYGILDPLDERLNDYQKDIAKITNKRKISGGIKDALKGADFLVGVSSGGLVNGEMIRSMAKDPIVFSLANPIPEISIDEAMDNGAYIYGSGSSKYPNQINNALVFPGLFRGILDAKVKRIDNEIMIDTAKALSNMIKKEDLRKDNILPKVIDKKAHIYLSERIKESVIKHQEEK